MFVTRYLDLFTTYYSLYNSLMKVLYISATTYIVYMVKYTEPFVTEYVNHGLCLGGCPLSCCCHVPLLLVHSQSLIIFCISIVQHHHTNNNPYISPPLNQLIQVRQAAGQLQAPRVRCGPLCCIRPLDRYLRGVGDRWVLVRLRRYATFNVQSRDIEGYISIS